MGVRAVQRRRLHPRRVPQGCRSRGWCSSPRCPARTPACSRWVTTWWTTVSPSPSRRCTAPRRGRRSARDGADSVAGCVAKEFAAFATNKDRPVSHYLRALARDLKEKTGSKGVGVIGQCFSGGFALAAAVDDSVLAPVLSQPSVPLPLTAAQRRDPGISEAEMKVIERRAADEGLCALGLRFSGDPLVPAERFKPSRTASGTRSRSSRSTRRRATPAASAGWRTRC